MKRSNLERLACPNCHGPLELGIVSGNGDSVEQGTLACPRCSQSFNIEEGVPRMFAIYDTEEASTSERFRVARSVVEAQVNKSVPAAEREGPLPSGKWHTPDYVKYFRLAYLGVAGLAFVVGIIVALVGLHKWGLAGALFGLVIFIADYIWYRWRERRMYQKHLLLLRQMMRAPGHTKGTQHLLTQMKPYHEVVPDQAAAGVLKNQLGEEEYKNQLSLVNWKSYKIEQALATVTPPGKRVLNIGCGGGLHTIVSRSYVEKGFEMVGLDYRQNYVLEFCSELQVDGVLGNALRLPFSDKSFDWVSCTDVIEHLLSPEQLLREIQRVLSDEGVLLMSTENATSFGFFASNPLACFSINPLIFMERIIGTLVPNILPPREIIGSWGGTIFVHNQFSHQDLEGLLRDSGLNPVRLETVFPIKEFEGVNQALAGLPFFKWMGYSLFTIAKKQKAGE